MKEIIVYQCEECFKESYNKTELRKHEIECIAAAKLKEKRKKELIKHKEKFINSFSFDNLIEHLLSSVEILKS